MPKYKVSIILISVLLFIMSICSYFIQNEISPCDQKKYFMNELIEGKVTQKYVHQAKKSFLKDTIIVLESGLSLSSKLSFSKALYFKVRINDSIVKKVNSDTLYLFRNDSLISIYHATFNCK